MTPYRLDDPLPLAGHPPHHAHTRAAAQVAAAAVRERIRAVPDVAIILGTGLGALGREIAQPATLEYGEIPGFPLSTVESHAGRLIAGSLGGKHVIAMQGRFHLYEGYTPQQVSFPVRVMRELGARTLVVSNASGGLHGDWTPGDLMCITDHLNLLGDNPLVGANDDGLGPRFPDMSAPYDAELRALAHTVAREQGTVLRDGVYAAVTGPSFETRAEYAMLHKLGADAVGMSTVPEVIVAVHGGMRVLGISMITDLCEPETLEPVTVERIIGTAASAEPRLTALVRGVLERM